MHYNLYLIWWNLNFLAHCAKVSLVKIQCLCPSSLRDETDVLMPEIDMPSEGYSVLKVEVAWFKDSFFRLFLHYILSYIFRNSVYVGKPQTKPKKNHLDMMFEHFMHSTGHDHMWWHTCHICQDQNKCWLIVCMSIVMSGTFTAIVYHLLRPPPPTISYLKITIIYFTNSI